jgi:hypothetical protein
MNAVISSVANSFTYGRGTESCSLVGSEDLAVSYHTQEEGRALTQILVAEKADFGIEDFCVRLVCQISRQSSQSKGLSAKYHLLAFPCTSTAALSEGALETQGKGREYTCSFRHKYCYYVSVYISSGIWCVAGCTEYSSGAKNYCPVSLISVYLSLPGIVTVSICAAKSMWRAVPGTACKLFCH